MYFISRVLCIYNDHLPPLLFQNAIRPTIDMAPHSWTMDNVLGPYSWIMDNMLGPCSWIMDNLLAPYYWIMDIPLAPETVPDFPNQCKDLPSVSYIPAFYI